MEEGRPGSGGVLGYLYSEINTVRLVIEISIIVCYLCYTLQVYGDIHTLCHNYNK